MIRAFARKLIAVQLILGWFPVLILFTAWGQFTAYSAGLIVVLEVLLIGLAYRAAAGELEWRRGGGVWER